MPCEVAWRCLIRVLDPCLGRGRWGGQAVEVAVWAVEGLEVGLGLLGRLSVLTIC